MRLYEFITETRKDAIPEELKLQIKHLYDTGVLVKDIASQLEIPFHKVANILKKYFHDRELRREDLTPEEIAKVKTLYDQGLPFKDIASESNLTIADIEGIMKYHYTDRTPRVDRRPLLTPEEKAKEMATLSRMYAAGATLNAMAKYVGISDVGVAYHLKRLPNFAKLKQQHNASIDAFKDDAKNQVTTNIYRAGSIGNDRLQGPGGRSNRGRTSNR